MSRASMKSLARLFHRLANSYSAGIDLLKIFQKEAGLGSPHWKRTMGDIAGQLKQGTSLTKAMRSQEEFFPRLAIAITQAGERGGRMDEAFRRLAIHYESLVKFRNNFLASIAWPVFELVAAIGIIGALILVMGFISSLNPEANIDIFGLGLGTAGNFLLYLIVVGSFVTTLLVLFFGTRLGWFGNLPMRLARRIPLIGPTIEAFSLSRFAWTASIAENAGMEAGDTMKLALESTENFYYLDLTDEVVNKVRSGNSFYKSLKGTDSFPDEFLIMVDNGETAGSLAESMELASVQLQEKAETNMKVIAQIGFVATFVFVACVVGFCVISLYYNVVMKPLYDTMGEFGY